MVSSTMPYRRDPLLEEIEVSYFPSSVPVSLAPEDEIPGFVHLGEEGALNFRGPVE